MSGQTLPAGIRVLRIMYIAHQQFEENGLTLAASASSALLRAAFKNNLQARISPAFQNTQAL